MSAELTAALDALDAAEAKIQELRDTASQQWAALARVRALAEKWHAQSPVHLWPRELLAALDGKP